jgi:MFS family permease
VSIGPALGSVSQRIGPRAPGFVAAVICVVNMGFVWRWVRESHVVERHPQSGAAPKPLVTSREATVRVMTHPAEPASRLIWIYAIGMGAFFGFNAILALFLAKRFGATAQNVGFFFTWVGSISVIVRAFLLGPAVDRFGEVKLSRIGLALLGLGFVLLPFTNNVRPGGGPHIAFHPAVAWLHRAAFDLSLEPRIVVLALVIALFPLGTAFTFPCVTGLLSQVIDQRERGVMMGVQQSYGGAARVLFPLLSGWTYEHLGTDYPSWTSAVLVAGTFLLSFGIRQPRDEPVAAASASPSSATPKPPSAEPEEPPAVAAR